MNKEELITMLQDVIMYIKGRSIAENLVNEKYYNQTHNKIAGGKENENC